MVLGAGMKRKQNQTKNSLMFSGFGGEADISRTRGKVTNREGNVYHASGAYSKGLGVSKGFPKETCLN